MAITLYQCKMCKCILSDSNSIIEQNQYQDIYAFSSTLILLIEKYLIDVKNIILGKELHLDDPDGNTTSCWKSVSCGEVLILTSFFNSI